MHAYIEYTSFVMHLRINRRNGVAIVEVLEFKFQLFSKIGKGHVRRNEQPENALDSPQLD